MCDEIIPEAEADPPNMRLKDRGEELGDTPWNPFRRGLIDPGYHRFLLTTPGGVVILRTTAVLDRGVLILLLLLSACMLRVPVPANFASLNEEDFT
jgi:hypothetical protein